jgi:hypothetical protein
MSPSNKQNRVRRFLSEVVGMDDPDKIGDVTGAALTRLFSDIREQHAAGLLSFAVAQDAERAVYRIFLEEAANNPQVYRALRANGQFEAIQNMGGYDSDGSPEQRERAQDDALAVVLGYAADAGIMEQRITPQQYHAMIDIADPAALADGRRRAGYDQTAKGDLDGRPRDLDANETGYVGVAAYAKRVGLTRQESAETPDEPEEAAAEHAGDWSASRMQKFVEQRERECEKSTDGPIPSDGVYHTPIND